MLPFLLISSYSTYKVLSSEITTSASQQIESKTFVAVEGDTSKAPPAVKPQVQPQRNPVVAPQAEPQAKPQASSSDTFFKEFSERSSVFLKTSHYYFWQVLLPENSSPVKGQVAKTTSLIDFFHILFLAILIYLNWGTIAGMCLIAGYLMLSPFLNIFTAPYMTLTWVI